MTDETNIYNKIENAAEHARSFRVTANPLTSNNTHKVYHSQSDTIVTREYTRQDYDFFRPSEQMPKDHRGLQQICNDIYFNVGIVRSVIDLMSDFSIKGIDWYHKNKNVQEFYRAWYKKVCGDEVSERLANYLLRLANAAIYTEYSKIKPEVAKEWQRTKGREFSNIDLAKGKIPAEYTFIDLNSLSDISGGLGNFVKKRVFLLTIPNTIVSIDPLNSTRRRSNPSVFQRLVDSIPAELKSKIAKGEGIYLVEDEDIKIYSYRKDDWEPWGRPIIGAILEPLLLLKKMHLADMSALDGAISNIRLWTVGWIDTTNIANSFIPSKKMLQKVEDVVKASLTGGVLDIVWGPELTFKESSTQVHNFLGPEKYQQVMSEIYDGLGIPPTLSSGGGTGSTGFTNNFVSMKTLIERLNYIRKKVKEFWEKEAEHVRQTMGFKNAATIVFDEASLSDDSQEKKLIIELYDRDIISLESVREYFSYLNPIENARIMREVKRRKKGFIPPKAGQFHDAMYQDKLNGELIKGGILSPDGQILEQSENFTPKKPEGRPPGSKDAIKRMPKTVTPRSATVAFVSINKWAREAFEEISNIVTPAYLNAKSKTSARQLLNTESDELEDIKLGVLATAAPYTEITEEFVQDACANMKQFDKYKELRSTLLVALEEKTNKKITIEDNRIAACGAYAMIKCSEI